MATEVYLPVFNVKATFPGPYEEIVPGPDGMNVQGDGGYGRIRLTEGGSGTLVKNTDDPMFDLAPATVGGVPPSAVDVVIRGYRATGGDHPSPDLSDPFSSLTYPTLNVQFAGDGIGSSAGKRFEPLPMGAYGTLILPVPAGWWSYIVEGWPGQPVGFEGLQVTFLAGPGDVMGLGEHDVFIDYFAFRVTYAGAAPAPPLRRRQRNDSLGNSARRKATSRQRSLRNTGYL